MFLLQLQRSKRPYESGPRELIGYEKGDLEIRLLQFINGADHKSANKAVDRLDPLGWYDTEFKTHIAIMGGYLVVLLGHYMSLNGILPHWQVSNGIFGRLG